MCILMKLCSLLFVGLFVYLIKRTEHLGKASKNKKMLHKYGYPFLALATAFVFSGSLCMKGGAGVKGKTEMFRKIIEANPNMIIEAIKSGQEKERAAEEAARADKVKVFEADKANSSTAPILGNPNGSKVVYEFYDFNCGYCKKAGKEVKALVAADKDIKVVLKNLPIMSSVSNVMAKAGIAAHLQGQEKGAKMYYALIEGNVMKDVQAKSAKAKSQEEIDAVILNVLKSVAKKQGLDTKKFASDMESPVVAEEIMKTEKAAADLGIRGTPAFIINGKFYGGYMPADRMIKILK